MPFTFAIALIISPSANGVPKATSHLPSAFATTVFTPSGVVTVKVAPGSAVPVIFLSPAFALFITGFSVLFIFGVTVIGCSAFLSFTFTSTFVWFFVKFSVGTVIPYSANFSAGTSTFFPFSSVNVTTIPAESNFSPSVYFVFVGGVFISIFAIFSLSNSFSLTVIGCSAFLSLTFTSTFVWSFVKFSVGTVIPYSANFSAGTSTFFPFSSVNVTTIPAGSNFSPSVYFVFVGGVFISIFAIFSLSNSFSLTFVTITSLVFPALSISWTVTCSSFFKVIPSGIPTLAFLAAIISAVNSTSTRLPFGSVTLTLSPTSTSFGRFTVTSLSPTYTSSIVGAEGSFKSITTSFDFSLSVFPVSVAVTVTLSPSFTVFGIGIENVPSGFAVVVATTSPLLFFNLTSEFAGALPVITALPILSS